MVKTKLTLALLCVVALSSCCTGLQWKKFPVDGSRTGVTAPLVDNVAETIGSFEDGVYTSPSGRVFDCGSTPAVAKLMMDAQDGMARLRVEIAQAAEELCKDRPQSPLSNFTVDAVMYKTALVTGKKIDMALTNFGGIRVDSFAEGVIMLDDVESAFPFNNYLCYIALKGSDLREMLESIVAKGIQPVAGVKLVIEGSKLVSVEVGGQPLDDERVYGLATVDFLLDGGDDIYAARNAIELIQSDVVIKEAILSYLDKLTVGGTVPLSYPIDDRVIIKEI